jgi:hypothetical protein
MDQEVFIAKNKYISSKRSADLYGYTYDYLSRLAKQGVIKGEKFGRAWYLEENSLKTFIENNKLDKGYERVYKSKRLKKEYKKNNGNPIEKVITSIDLKKDEIRKQTAKALVPYASHLPKLVHSKPFEKIITFALAGSLVFGVFFFQQTALSEEIGFKTISYLEDTISTLGDVKNKINENKRLALNDLRKDTEVFIKTIINSEQVFESGSSVVGNSESKINSFLSVETFVNFGDKLLSYSDLIDGHLLEIQKQGLTHFFNQRAIVSDDGKLAAGVVSEVYSYWGGRLQSFSRSFYCSVNNFLELESNCLTKTTPVKKQSTAIVKTEQPKGTSTPKVAQKETPKDTEIPKEKIVYVQTAPVETKIIERVGASGVSLSTLQFAVDSLRQEFFGEIDSKLGNINTGQNTIIQNVYQSIAQSNNIDRLQEITIIDPIITGGSITSNEIRGVFSGAVVSTNISFTGNLSYGTSTPWGKISVVSTTTPPLAIGDSSNNTDFVVTSDGNVGIGTSTPSATFAVDGNSFFNGSVNFAGVGTNLLLSTNSFGVVSSTSTPVVASIIATSTTATSTLAGNLSIGGANGIYITGNGAGLRFSGTGNHDIEVESGTLRIGSNTIMGNIEALNNTIDIGTPGTRFDKIYADEVNASSIVGTIVGGNVSAETLNINSDNATADTEDSYLAFERGSLSPNALLQWNSSQDLFDLNQPLFIQNDNSTTTIVTLDLKGTAGQTANIFNVASSTGTSLFNVSGAGVTSFLYASGTSATTSDRLYTGGLTVGGPNGFASVATIGDIRSSNNQTWYFRNTNDNGNVQALRFLNDLVNFGTGITVAGHAVPAETGVYNLGSGSLMWNNGYFSNSIGIGTSSPGQKLSVAGDILGNNIINSYVTATSTTATSTFAGGFAVETSGLVYDHSTNNVGIGTASPTVKLYVNNGALTVTGTNTSDEIVGNFGGGGASNYQLRLTGGQNFDIRNIGTTRVDFEIADDPKISILSGGNVGIGTTTPTAKLHSLATTEQLRLGYDSSNYTSFTADSSGNLTVDPSSAGANFVFDGSNSSLRPSSASGADLGLTGTRWSTLYLGNHIYAGGIVNLEGNNVVMTMTGTTPVIETVNSGMVLRPAGTFAIQDRNASNIVRLAIDSSGNVGIGTSTPYAPLSVAGHGGVVANIFTATSTNATSTFAGGFSIETSGFVYDRSTNNVGIGTASPGGKLDVAGDIRLTTNSSFVGTPGVGKIFKAEDNGLTLQAVAGSGNDFTLLNPGGSTHLIANPTGTTNVVFTATGALGNVGIGNYSPNEKLNVQGTVAAQIFTATSTTATSTFAGGFAVETSGLVYDRSTNFVGIGTASPGNALHVVGSAQVPFQLQSTDSQVYQRLSNSSDSSVYVGNNAGTYLVQTNATTRLSILNGGNVGIGTTSPFAKFSLHASNGETNTTLFNIASSTATATTSLFTVLNSGNVGVGTLNPGEKLDVQFSSTAGIRAYNTTASGISVLTLKNPSRQWELSLRGDSAGAFDDEFNIQDGTGSTIPFRIQTAAPSNSLVITTTTGNIGLGTTSPYAPLSVAGHGGVVANIFTATSTTATSTFAGGFAVETSGFVYDYSTNNVGIGTASPGAGLDLVTLTNPALRVKTSTGGSNYEDLIYLDGTANGNIGSVYRIGVSWDGSTDQMFLGKTGQRTLVITEDGNVGIGTTNPGVKLEIADATSPSIQVVDTTNTVQTRIQSDNTSGYLTTNTNHPLSLAANGSVAMTILPSGNVGIGTTNPQSQLEIYNSVGTSTLRLHGSQTSGSQAIGQINFSNITDITGGYIVGRIESLRNTFDNGGDLAFSTAAAASTPTERMRIDRNGNVGIGTTNPTYSLDVNGLMRVRSGTFNTEGGIIGLDGAAGNLTFTSGATNTGFRFLNSSTGTEFMTVLGSGNVGIGTTSPYASLSVAGHSGVVANIFTATSTTATSTFAGGLAVETSGLVYDRSTNNVGIGTASPVGNLHISNTGTLSYSPTTYQDQHAVVVQQNSSTNYFSNIRFQNNSNLENFFGVVQDSNGIGNFFFKAHKGSGIYGELMRISGSGNVGISTTSPYAKLSLHANNGETNTTLFAIASSTATATTTLLTVLNTGNVGIGTASPSNKLHVVGTNNEIASIVGASSPYLTIGTDSNAGGFIRWNTDSNSMQIGPHASNQATIIGANNGNVGISTTSPYASLSVAGHSGVVANIFTATSTTATSTFAGGLTIETSGLVYDYSTNNVGIGTASPTSKVHIDGASTQGISTLVRNTNSGVGSHSEFALGNDAGGAEAGFRMNSSIFSNSGYNLSASASLYTQATNGLSIAASNASGLIRFYTGGTSEVARISSSGNFGIGTTSPYSKLSLQNLATDTTQPLFTIASSTATATTTLLTVLNSGYVGIGTQSPETTLEVNGTAKFGQGAAKLYVYSNSSVAYLSNGASGAGEGLYTTAGTRTSLMVGNAGILDVISTGVGIGTTSPYASLSVAGHSGVVANIFTATSTSATSTFAGGLAVETSGLVYDYSSNNVGIATSSPSRKLSVSGDIYLTGGLGVGLVNTTAGSISTTGNIRTNTSLITGGVLNCNAASSAIQTDGTGTLTCGSISAIGGTSAGGWTWIFPDYVRLATTSDRVIIGSSGSPTEKVEIHSGSAATSTLGLHPAAAQTAPILSIYNTSGSLASVFTSAHKFGIGETTPVNELHISGSSGPGIRVTDTDNGVTLTDGFFVQQSDSNTFLWNYENGFIDFGTNSLSQMRILSSGNVGIGNTSPNEKLNVQGTIAGQVLQATSTSATSTFAGGLAVETSGLVYDYSSNNVGIATSSPSRKLSVSGDIYLTGGLGVGLVNTTAGSISTTGNIRTNTSLITGGVLNCNAASSAIQTDGTGTLTCGSISAIGGTSAGGWTWIFPDYVRLATTSDRVIIGSSGSPTEKVEIHSGSAATSTLGLHPAAAQTAPILSIYNTSGSLASVFTSAHKFGIGETTPVNELHISGSSGPGIRVTDTDNGVTLTDGFFVQQSDSNTFLWNYENGFIDFGTNSLSQMRILSSGNVGIGNTSPNEKLNVQGTIAGQVLQATSTSATSTFAGGLAVATSGLVYDRSTGNVGIGTASPGQLLDVIGAIRTSTTLLFDAGVLGLRDTGSNVVSFDGGSSHPSGYRFTTTGATNGAVEILSGGNVGVGTTSPYAKLSLHANNGETNYALLTVASSTATATTTHLTVLNGGNVGIGTASPQFKLTISGTSDGLGIVPSDSPFGTRLIIVGGGPSGLGATSDVMTNFNGVWNTNDSSLVSDFTGYAFRTNGTERVRIDPTGNLGVGTTSPYAKLSLHANNGETNTTLFNIASSTATATSTIFSVLNSGYVGIGTNAPSSKLHISGSGQAVDIVALTDVSPEYIRIRTSASSGMGYFGVEGSSAGTTVTNTLAYATLLSSGASGTALQLGAAGDIKMTILSTGNVGIGTTAPVSPLNVKGSTGYGSIKISPASDDGEASMGFMRDAAGTDTNDAWVIGQAGWGNIGDFVIGNENNGNGGNVRLLIEKSGNVGIGSTTPSQNLSVQGTGDVFASLNSTNGGGDVGVMFNNTGDNSHTYQLYREDALGSLDVYHSHTGGGTGRGTMFSVDGANNDINLNALVGISSTSPWAKLSVNPSALGAGVPEFVIGSSSATHLIVDGGGNVGIGTASPTSALSVYPSSATGGIQIAAQATLLSFTDTNGGQTSSYISVDNGGWIFNNGSSFMSVNALGSVGIGSTTPWAKLSVNPSALGSGVPEFAIGSSSATHFIVDGGGNVGIGTTTPSYRLDVQAFSNGAAEIMRLYNPVADSNPHLRIENDARHYSIQTVGARSDNFEIMDSTAGSGASAVRLAINTSGNVGIGTTSPYAKLSLHANNGETNTTLFNIASSTATATTTHFAVINTGNVGIGTSNPSAKLHVEGSSGTPPSLNAETAAIFTRYGSGGSNNYLSIMSGNTGNAGIFLGDSDSQAVGQIIYSNTLNSLGFATNASTALTITSSGNVGIGTTTPAAKLQVKGETYFGDVGTAGTFRLYDSSSTGTGSYINFANSLGRLTITGGNGSASSENTVAIQATTIPGTDETYALGTAANRWASLRIGTGNAIFDGSVGVGTTSPYASLSVAGHTGVVANIFTATSTTATSTFAGGLSIETSGFVYDRSTNSVGIGTASPSRTLDVVGTGGFTGLVMNTVSGVAFLAQPTTGTNSALYRVNTTGNDSSFGAESSAGGTTFTGSTAYATLIGNVLARPIQLATNSTVRVTIDSTGLFGIGTTTPYSKLSVHANNGETNLGLFTIASSTQTATTTIMTVLNTGVTGFGTTSPYAKLSLHANFGENNLTLLSIASSSQTATSTLLALRNNGNLGIGTSTPGYKLTVASGGSLTALIGTASTDELILGGGLGKITVGTIDPPYDIGGNKYATYVSGMVGQKEETTGVANIVEQVTDSNGNIGYKYEIDFDTQEVGSDLWLFSKTTEMRKNIDKLVTLLTPEGDSKVWYRIDKSENKIILLSNKPTKVSFRFTAPRFDAVNWTNNRDNSLVGFTVPEYDDNVYFEDEGDIDFGFGSSSLSQLTLPQVIDELASLGVSFVDNVVKMTSLVTEKIVVGSPEKPTGITLYDEVTGEPYCLSIKNGQTSSVAGVCGANNSGQPTNQLEENNPPADTEPPVITINGNNPAQVELNSNYVDLGATVTDNVDQNLGITASVDGVEVGNIGNISLDTSISGEHTIIYSVTDNTGNSASSTRTVIVGGSQ